MFYLLNPLYLISHFSSSFLFSLFIPSVALLWGVENHDSGLKRTKIIAGKTFVVVIKKGVT